jgi:hypothetical protein
MINDATGARHVPRDLKGMSGDDKIRGNFSIDGVSYAPSSLRTEGITVKPSGFREYDNLSGYVTGNYVSEWTDRWGNRWRTITTVVNLGRPDRGIAVDPDDAMTPDVWVDDQQREIEQAQRGYAVERNRVERHRVAMEQLTAYMQAHGPTVVPELLMVVDWASRTLLTEHLTMFPDVYLRYWDRPQVWGLYGQTYKRTFDDMPVADRLTQVMTKHGPLTMKELMARTGATREGIRRQLQDRSDLFVMVDRREEKRQGPKADVWGLVGA